MTLSNKVSRNDEITTSYLAFLDKHIADIVSGRAIEMMTLKAIAEELCITAEHLSSTIQLNMGHHPCHFYDEKILKEAKRLLNDTEYSIADIARRLTYDPSNFSKFFKKYAHETPGQFRKRSKK